MKAIRAIIIAVLTMPIMASCDIETSGNDDLDGFWHLVRVDTLSTGGTCDMSAKRVFWGVQLHLLNVADYDKSAKGYLLRFENTGTSLRVFDPYTDNRMEGDIKVDDPSVLSPLGINALDETFNIEILSGSRMQLATEELRLNFTKM